MRNKPRARSDAEAIDDFRSGKVGQYLAAAKAAATALNGADGQLLGNGLGQDGQYARFPDAAFLGRKMALALFGDDGGNARIVGAGFQKARVEGFDDEVPQFRIHRAIVYG